MKNVLLFTHSLSGGGAEKAVRRLAKYINSHEFGYKIYVCVVYDDPNFHDEVDNLIVLKTKSEKNDSKITKGINVIKQINEVKKIKKHYQIDLCVSFLPGADIINVLSSTGEKKVVSVRNKESLFTHNIFKKIYVKTSYLLCDRIVAVTDVVKNDCIDFFGVPEEKITTIYNAIDDNESPDNEGDFADRINLEVAQFARNSHVIVNAGRLSVEKGQQHLIKAFAYVADKFPEYKLLVLGEGYYRENLQKLIDDLGLNDKVLLAGRVNNPKDYFKMADLFVLASDVEGMPNVILEAMQCGLPCISTDCGAREILAPDTPPLKMTDEIEMAQYGILVPVCGNNVVEKDIYSQKLTVNEQILGDAMMKMISDKGLSEHYSVCGNDRIAYFTMDKIAAGWTALFDKLIS